MHNENQRIAEVSSVSFNDETKQTSFTITRYDVSANGAKHVLHRQEGLWVENPATGKPHKGKLSDEEMKAYASRLVEGSIEVIVVEETTVGDLPVKK